MGTLRVIHGGGERSGGACPSALQLDQLLAGELPRAAAAITEAHLVACARCADRMAAHRADRAAFRAAPPPLPRALAAASEGISPLRAPQRARSRAGWAAACATVAAAAGLVLWLGRDPGAPPVAERPAHEAAPGLRAKGAGPARLGVYIRRGDEVVAGASGDRVAPGDALRFTITTDELRHVAVLGRDGAGSVAVYFPDGPRAEDVGVGDDLPLPFSVTLDDVLGLETYWGVLCAEPVEVARIRAHLFAGAAAVPGCLVDQLVLEKRARDPAGGAAGDPGGPTPPAGGRARPEENAPR
jgi:hypothetical protein